MPKPTTLDNPKAVVIVHQGLYWAPLSCGYTNQLIHAGVYEPFEPWRDDKLIPVEQAMKEKGFEEEDREFLAAKAKKSLEKYLARVTA